MPSPAPPCLALPDNEKAFLIGLQRNAPERGRPTREVWREAGLAPEWWEGVDGGRPMALRPDEKISRLFLSPFLRGDIARGRANAETRVVACFLSHYRLWKHCLEAGYGRVLIVEDDTVPDGLLRKIWPELLALNDSFEVIKLFEHYWPRHLMDDAARREYALQDFSEPGVGLHRLFSDVTGTGGYLATREGLKKLAAHAMPIRWEIDVYLDNIYAHNARLFTVIPSPLRERTMESSISKDGRRVDYRESAWENFIQEIFLGLRVVLYFIRRMKKKMVVLRAPRGAFYPPRLRYPPHLPGRISYPVIRWLKKRGKRFGGK